MCIYILRMYVLCVNYVYGYTSIYGLNTWDLGDLIRNLSHGEKQRGDVN